MFIYVMVFHRADNIGPILISRSHIQSQIYSCI